VSLRLTVTCKPYRLNVVMPSVVAPSGAFSNLNFGLKTNEELN
jgi:hypothetical protein